MSRALLVLRPEPGASATVARIAARGLAAAVAPLFAVRPIGWEPPDPAGFDAVMMTSASAAREGGAGLAAYTHLPLYAVGGATAAAAQGFATIVAGATDGAALIAAAEADGRRRILHFCGHDHIPYPGRLAEVTRCPVYASEACAALPPAAAGALGQGAVALLHSPRAARLFGGLVDSAGLARASIALAALSPAVAEAAGAGWARVAVAECPTDDALLAIAAGLCD